MSDIQKIKIKRTDQTLPQITDPQSNNKIDYGEPVFVKDGYLLIGNTDNSNMSTCRVAKLQDRSRVDNSVFYTGNTNSAQLTTDNGTNIIPKTTAANVSFNDSNLNAIATTVTNMVNGNTAAAKATTATTATNANNLKTVSAENSSYFILGVETTTNTNKQVYHAAPVSGATSGNTAGIYFNNTGALFGAAWNDFAEFRECDFAVPGTCVVETGFGSLKISDKYLLPAASIITDTFGMVIGENTDSSQPVAVAGRVLAFVEDKDKLQAGDALKTAPGGKLAKMTRREIRKYPDRIVGYVSEFPSYDKWNDVEVNGRIWVKVK